MRNTLNYRNVSGIPSHLPCYQGVPIQVNIQHVAELHSDLSISYSGSIQLGWHAVYIAAEQLGI